MSNTIIEIKVGDRYQQKGTGRICTIIRVSEARIQYLYEYEEEEKRKKMRFNTSKRERFIKNFVKMSASDSPKSNKPTN